MMYWSYLSDYSKEERLNVLKIKAYFEQNVICIIYVSCYSRSAWNFKEWLEILEYDGGDKDVYNV